MKSNETSKERQTMKRFAAWLLLAALCALFSVCATAVDGVVYLADGGTGDGTSADSPLGSLNDAYAALTDGGTAVVCGTYTVGERFVAPTHAGKVTVTSVFGGVDYAKTAGAALYFGAPFFCGGETEFCDISIINTKNSLGIYGYFYPLTMGDGLTCSFEGDATGYMTVLGGATNPNGKACSLTINSGIWHRVRGGCSKGNAAKPYSVDLTINGGRVVERAFCGPDGAFSGNIRLTVNGGTLQNGIVVFAPAADTDSFSGEIALSVNGGSIGGAILLSTNNAVGTYGGSFSVTLDGGDFSRLTALSGNAGMQSVLTVGETVSLDREVVGSVSFGNMIRKNGADPWLFKYDGNYYYIATGGTSLLLYCASNLADFPTAAGKVIYKPESGKAWSADLWSPEIHYFSAEDVGADNAGWYCFLGSDSGKADETGSVFGGQRAYVIKCLDGDNLLGRWGNPVTGEVNVPQLIAFPDSDYNDAELCGGCSVLRIDGKPYITFISEAGRGTSDFHQMICIAEFENPWTVVGTPGIICTPTYDWEAGGYGESTSKPGNWYPKVVEGATAVYGDDGSVFIVYSGSGYWTPYYSLGQLTYTGGDPKSAENWSKKPTPILTKSDSLCGTGHASYLTDYDGNRWICYHAYRGTTTANGRNAFVEPYSADAANGVVIGAGTTLPAEPDTVYTTVLNKTPLQQKTKNFDTVRKLAVSDSGAQYDAIAARAGDAAFELYSFTQSGDAAASAAFETTLPADASDSRLLYRVRGEYITPLSTAPDADGRIPIAAEVGDGYVFADAPLVNYGDVNSDGALSLIDVILVLRRASQYTDSIDIAAADLNGDETVDLRDCLCALRKMLNG